jgi:uncharacterized protein (DUF58 family)
MNVIKRTTNWLETRGSTPAFSGWVLAGITICFFGAAINTMAGWLYVISGVSLALLGLAAVLPQQQLTSLAVKRYPMQPVTVGDELTVELEICNQTKQSVSLLKVEDIVPFVLGKPIQKSIEIIAAGDSYRWVYYHLTQRRGVYRWQNVELASGAPLGLFWSRRHRECHATAIVYPTVLSLAQCPLIDEMGQDDSKRSDPTGNPFQTATEGLTRSLRPYRTGDPIRLIHWRTSARYGELRVRELEKVTGGQDIVIAIDSAGNWQEENFEQAVIAAASMYFYAQRQQMYVQLWTAFTGLVKGERQVLETLAATTSLEETSTPVPSNSPLIWLTQNPLTLPSLVRGSRTLLWQKASSPSEKFIVNHNYPGTAIESDQPLQTQLQKSLRT